VSPTQGVVSCDPAAALGYAAAPETTSVAVEQPDPERESSGEADFERDPTLAPGATFGAYSIDRCVGRGGMGAVYAARHRELGKRVALKALHRRIAVDPRARARFLAEGRATSRLRHPHVVDVSDHGILDGVPFLVMEFLEGETLADLIERDGALSVARAVEVMLPVCAAVSATHQEGIVHRDLKPSNIFLSRDGLGREQIKVLDFGVSKIESPEVDGLTSTGALIGTPWYMSPEQAQDPRNAHAASDQYTLGVILVECVTGRRAFEGKSLYPVLRSIVTGDMARPRALRPDLPEEFEDVILRATRVDISDRYPCVDDLARALLPFAARASRDSWRPVFHPSAAAEPAAPEPAPAHRSAPAIVTRVDVLEPPSAIPPRPRSRGVAVSAVVALAALALALGWWTFRVAPPPVHAPLLAAGAPAPGPAPAPPSAAVVAADTPPLAPPVLPAPPTAPPDVAAAPVPRPLARAARPAAAVGRRQLGANGAPIEE
jgi:serine/threonine protein kinase